MFTFSNDSQTSFVNLWGSPWSLKSSKLSCEAQPPPPCPHPQFVWVPLQTFNRLLSTWANSNEFLLLATQTALIQIAPTSVRELETRGRMEAGQTEDRMCESGWSSMLIQNPWGLCGGKEKWNTGNMTNFKRNLDKSLSHHPKSHCLWAPSMYVWLGTIYVLGENAQSAKKGKTQPLHVRKLQCLLSTDAVQGWLSSCSFCQEF